MTEQFWKQILNVNEDIVHPPLSFLFYFLAAAPRQEFPRSVC